MKLRAAGAGDIDWIMALERRPENSAYVSVNDAEEHKRFITSPESATLILDDGEQLFGFAILCGLNSAARSVELMRIVVDQPGRGTGGRFLQALINHVFSELGANRLWLDVFDDNGRGRAAYRREGFVEEGVMRECALKTNGELGSLVVMSILRRDWAAPGPGAGPGTG